MIRRLRRLRAPRGLSDLALAAAALALVSALFAPLPPWMVDLGLAFSLAFSATILVVALFARDALRFASFPTLLLFTTLLRLALEVSSTRLVLSRGEAGRVIDAFGRVVVAGDWVVGGVVFAILTVVQLLVVAKGAERVAEVAARFTLDALPGKQMSIDAELRAGSIDPAEARRRRRALEREGQLYGAMDGALKFVKGDALAGVAIVIVNVLGGLLAGLLHGMSLEAAARRYAILAIGDGLAAQIPALLVSLAAGVAVTRVAAEEEGGSLAEEMAGQLFGDPRPLAAVAVLCAGAALAPGMPAVPFLLVAAAAGLGARFAHLRRGGAGRAPAAQGPADRAPDAGEGSTRSPVVLELADDLAGSDRVARELLPSLASDLWTELGVRLPPVQVRRGGLAPGAWRLLVDEVPAASGFARLGERLALVSPAELHALGILAAREPEPLTGALAARISSTDAERAAAVAPVRDPWERVAASAAAALRRHAHLLVGVQEVQAMVEGLEASHPALIREAARQLPAPLLAEVLRALLEEGVSIRPMRTLLDAMLEAGGAARGAAGLASSCRRALRRHFAHAHAPSGVLHALLLDPAAEGALREALCDGAAVLAPGATLALLDDLERAFAEAEGEAEAVLLTAPEIRRAVRQVVSPRFPRLTVLSYQELPETLAVRPLGRIAMGMAA